MTLGGRGGHSYLRRESGEHPGSLVPAAVMGTPPQSTSPPFLPLSGFFCVNCAIFILFFFPLFTKK